MNYYSYGSIGTVTLRGPEALEAATALHHLLAADSGQDKMDGSGDYMGRIELAYTLNDGRTMKRVYYAYGGEELLAAYAALEDTPEFQSRTNPLYYWIAEETPYKQIDLCDETGLSTLELTDAEYDLAALVAALRQDLLEEKAMDYYDPARKTVCYLYLQSELEERYSKEPAEKDFYGSFTVPVSENYTHTLELLRAWGLEDYLVSAEWDAIAVSVWGCEVEGTGRVIIPLWYGAAFDNFTLSNYDCILLDREDAAPLLQKATWTHPNTGNDDCLYLSFVREEADGSLTYGLPMFLPLEEARRQPALEEFIAEHYGDGMFIPSTEDAELLIAK